MALIAHPVPGKLKAQLICKAFIDGAPKNAQGDVFFGVNHGNLAPYLRAKALGRDWYYLDNTYFDKHRGMYFRVTKNALQCSGAESSDGKRFRSMGVEIKPWRETLGDTLLLCEQNDNFMATAVGYKGNWRRNTLATLMMLKPPYKVRLRPWNPDKKQNAITLLHELPGLRAVITHSSGSAITALLEGTPAISESGAARLLTGPLTRENLLHWTRPSNREQFAWALADNMWTLDEIRNGEAWAWLNRSK